MDIRESLKKIDRRTGITWLVLLFLAYKVYDQADEIRHLKYRTDDAYTKALNAANQVEDIDGRLDNCRCAN